MEPAILISFASAALALGATIYGFIKTALREPNLLGMPFLAATRATLFDGGISKNLPRLLTEMGPQLAEMEKRVAEMEKLRAEMEKLRAERLKILKERVEPHPILRESTDSTLEAINAFQKLLAANVGHGESLAARKAILDAFLLRLSFEANLLRLQIASEEENISQGKGNVGD